MHENLENETDEENREMSLPALALRAFQHSCRLRLRWASGKRETAFAFFFDQLGEGEPLMFCFFYVCVCLRLYSIFYLCTYTVSCKRIKSLLSVLYKNFISDQMAESQSAIITYKLIGCM